MNIFIDVYIDIYDFFWYYIDFFLNCLMNFVIKKKENMFVIFFNFIKGRFILIDWKIIIMICFCVIFFLKIKLGS